MRSFVIGTAGHIDHGKSALVEALTGTNPDRLEEEKARGITIDLGFAHATLGDVVVAFVDVPGHERFVRNMLAGAGGIDAVMLVVAADESVKPQTREHFHVCRLLGLERGLVALTKIDRVDEDEAELAALDVRELVAGSFLDGAPIVPVSARTTAGLDALRAELLALADVAPRQAREGIVRLPVDRAFSAKGFGTVITGTLVSGAVREGTELAALPARRIVRVRGVQAHGASVREVRAPGRVALNLGAIGVSEIARGVTLATAGSLSVTRSLDVRLEVLPGGRGLRHGARLCIHQGTAETTARLVLSAGRAASAAPWQLFQPDEAEVMIPAGGEAYGRLRLEGPLAVTRGDRLVLRLITPASTIGGAVVLDPEPPSIPLRRQKTLDRFRALDPSISDDPVAAVRVWLNESAARGLTAADAIRRGGLDSASAAAAIDQLIARGEALGADRRCFPMTAAVALERRVSAMLAQFHADHPADPGIPREALRDQAVLQGTRHLFDVIVDKLSTSQVIRGTDRLGLASHAASSEEGAESRRVRDWIEEIIRQAGLGPPDVGTVQRTSGALHADFDRHVRSLLRDRRIARLETLLFHADALGKLQSDLRALKQATSPGLETWLDVATFKARYGLSRKYAIPLLEWLDRERVTRRVGDRRLVI